MGTFKITKKVREILKKRLRISQNDHKTYQERILQQRKQSRKFLQNELLPSRNHKNWRNNRNTNSDSNWEQTNEPIELKPPSSIDDVIKPVQPNPYNAIISESTHSSNIAFISSKFYSYSSAVKYNPNQTHIQAESALVDSDDELASEKLYSKLKCGTDSSRVTG